MENLGRYHLQGSKLTSLVTIKIEIVCYFIAINPKNTVSFLILAKMHNCHEDKPDQSKRRDSFQNNWPVVFKFQDDESQRNNEKLFQVEGD